VSHVFVRREILALERRGIEVARIAFRGWDAEVVDRLQLAWRMGTHAERPLAVHLVYLAGPVASSRGRAQQTLSTCTRISAPIRLRLQCYFMHWVARGGALPCMAQRSLTRRSSLAWQRRFGVVRLWWQSVRMGAVSSIGGTHSLVQNKGGPLRIGTCLSCSPWKTDTFGPAPCLCRPHLRTKGPIATHRGGATTCLHGGTFRIGACVRC
jgi:hypothetical protein